MRDLVLNVLTRYYTIFCKNGYILMQITNKYLMCYLSTDILHFSLTVKKLHQSRQNSDCEWLIHTRMWAISLTQMQP